MFRYSAEFVVLEDFMSSTLMLDVVKVAHCKDDLLEIPQPSSGEMELQGFLGIREIFEEDLKPIVNRIDEASHPCS